MPTATASPISIEAVLERPGITKDEVKSVFFAVRFVHNHTGGEGATLFDVYKALDDKDQPLTDEKIARAFIILREKELIEQCGTTSYDRIIVRPTGAR